MSNILKDIHKPIDNDNGNNACWFNSSLYLVSSHPYIFFQYLLVSNNNITNNNIERDLYFKYIIYNYKYVKSFANKKSNILYDSNYHINFHNYLSKYNIIKPMPSYGETGDSQDVLNYLVFLLTKNNVTSNKLVYLIYKSDFINNPNDIDNKFIYREVITKKNEITKKEETTIIDYKLFGFTISWKCAKYDPKMKNNKGLFPNDYDAFHWITYVRTDFNNDEYWYLFDASDGKSGMNGYNIVKKNEIYKCTNYGDKKTMACIYIDTKKFNNIFSNKQIQKIYNIFVKEIKPVKYSNNNDFIKKIKNIELLELRLQNILKFDLNLFTIKELEKIFEKQITTDYFRKKDKRAYFNQLIK